MRRYTWFLELFSHFTPHGAAAAFLLALAFLALRAPRWAAAAAVVALADMLLAAQHFVPPRTPDLSASGTRLGILHFNVGFRHTEPQRVVDYVLANIDRFDVVVLIEAPPQWAPELRRLGKAYPHAAQELEDTPWGIAVFSKLKPLEARIVESPDGARHSEMRVALAGRDRAVAIYGIHPPPPVGRVLAQGRNAKLDHLARRIRDRECSRLPGSAYRSTTRSSRPTWTSSRTKSGPTWAPITCRSW